MPVQLNRAYALINRDLLEHARKTDKRFGVPGHGFKRCGDFACRIDERPYSETPQVRKENTRRKPRGRCSLSPIKGKCPMKCCVKV